MKVSVVGTGYVGLSLSVLLARKHEVKAIDIVRDKIDSINNRVSPIVDSHIQDYLSNMDLDLVASSDYSMCADSEFVVLALPTNFDCKMNHFDTSILEDGMKKVMEHNPDCTIVIKSTVPVGFTMTMADRMQTDNLLYSPEFLREGRALFDNLHPSRIIVGTPSDDPRSKKRAEEFAEMLRDCSEEEDVPRLIVGSTEAETIKLFSNAYLAMRISFFNEMDSFAELHSLDPRAVIRGVCMDPRIGDGYNNPSFGYGGYCLPKDTRQLGFEFHDLPNSMIGAIIDSNRTRREFIVERLFRRIEEDGVDVVGIYRLNMKSGSDNFRESSVLGIMKRLGEMGVDMLIYEPTISQDEYLGFRVIHDLELFKDTCGLVIANRYSSELDDIMGKVYCRDVFMRD